MSVETKKLSAKEQKDLDKKNAAAAKETKAAAAGTGATASAPVVTPTAAAPAAAAAAKKIPAGVLLLKKMPPTKGNAKGRRGSNGVKQPYYAVFGIPYADWHTGKFIANGQLANVYVEGQPQTPENRVFVVMDTTTGEEIARYEGAEAAKAFVPTTTSVIMPLQILDEETIPVTAHFRKNGALADHFTKLAADCLVSDPALSAQHTATAAQYAGENIYGGYVCVLAADVDKVVANVRDYFGANPDTQQKGFAEILNYFPVYGQADMPLILNTELDKAQKEAAAAAPKAAVQA